MPTQTLSPFQKNLAQYIDHTLLRPEATEPEIEKLCCEARDFGFRTVCIEVKWLTLAQRLLKDSAVLPITVIGFPKGNVSTAVKREETMEAVRLGAQELDMVLNRDRLAAKDYVAVLQDIQAVVTAAGDLPVKVILEASELSQVEKEIACALAKAAGAKFVKTSTGFSKSGATEADLRLMRTIVGEDIGVKASGGIRTLADAERMIAAGANRLGTSASVSIVQAASGSEAISSTLTALAGETY